MVLNQFMNDVNILVIVADNGQFDQPIKMFLNHAEEFKTSCCKATATEGTEIALNIGAILNGSHTAHEMRLIAISGATTELILDFCGIHVNVDIYGAILEWSSFK